MKKSFKSKWENFWYHYKFHFFVGMFFFVAIGYTLFNHLSTQHADLTIVYVGEARDTSIMEGVINERFGPIIEDANKDGKKLIQVKEIATTPYQIKNDLNFWQQVDIQMISKENYLFIMEEFTYFEFLNRKYIGEFITEKGNLNFIDLSNNPYFKTEDWKIGACYLTVPPTDPKEYKNQYQINNGMLIINKILEN